MNLDAEEGRLKFILNRDGREAARLKAKELKSTYLRAALKTSFRVRVKDGHKYKNKKYFFRCSYVESALSCRYILRHGFLK